MLPTRSLQMMLLALDPPISLRLSSGFVQWTPSDEVASAVRYIREHACSGIRAEDVYRHLKLSRSTLQRRFLRQLGHSPKEEILAVRLQRVKQLLGETGYPLAKIARLAGFRHTETMCTMFKRRLGQTPGGYRKATQLRGHVRPLGNR